MWKSNLLLAGRTISYYNSASFLRRQARRREKRILALDRPLLLHRASLNYSRHVTSTLASEGVVKIVHVSGKADVARKTNPPSAFARPCSRTSWTRSGLNARLPRRETRTQLNIQKTPLPRNVALVISESCTIWIGMRAACRHTSAETFEEWQEIDGSLPQQT